MRVSIRCSTALNGLAILVLCLPFVACGGKDDAKGHPLLGSIEEAAFDVAGPLEITVPELLGPQIERMARDSRSLDGGDGVTVDYPLDGSVFPPEFVPPTFLWHDDDPEVDTWLIEIRASSADAGPILVLVPGAPPPKGQIDEEAFGETNEPYEGTDYQNSARSWTPTARVWGEIKRRSVEAPATLTFTGFASGEPDAPRSRGLVRITTSKDPVGAPFFYRDVPLTPSVGKDGTIKPLGVKSIPLIAWRLKDVSRSDSKLVLKGMSSCGNCHSFSLDGKTLGMDVDGPDGDKGMYAIKPVAKEMVIDKGDVITWNSFPGKPEGHRTIGFLSRVSPDGQHVVTTLNEALYVTNFKNYRFLQVFYPTRGILAYYSRADGRIRPLAGADDPEFVHCGAVWSPDGSQLVFMRGNAETPFVDGQKMPEYSNDPNELPMRYSLYRIPFDGGRGGRPVPIEGASHNGMSNTFAKVSPDGRWIVFTKCGNGLLMRPDSRLWIVPFEGGEAREMSCNTKLMNSWHSWSPNGRWLVFSSKSNTPYTQAFLTHIDEDGNDSPAILVPNCTAANRAVNLPEFLNASIDDLDSITVPAANHHIHTMAAERHIGDGEFEKAIAALEKALELDPTFVRAHFAMGIALDRMGRGEDALRCFERAAELDPQAMVEQRRLGLANLELGRAQAAVATLEDLARFAPGFPRVRKSLARARRRCDELRKEIEEGRRELDADPGNAELHERLATLYRNVGEPGEQAKHLDKVVELKPDDAESITALVWLRAACPEESVRDGQRAVELAERAVSLTERREIEPLDALAAALAEAEKFDRAVSVAETAVVKAREVSAYRAAEIGRRAALYRAGQPYRTWSPPE